MAEEIKTHEGEERTFTQDEVNVIVGERLRREREKYADYEELKGKAEKYDEGIENGKTEMEKQREAIKDLEAKLNGYTKAEELRKIREKVSKETSIPIELLTCETEEDCKKQAEAIAKFAKPKEYPSPRKNISHPENNDNTDEAMRELARKLFGKGD